MRFHISYARSTACLYKDLRDHLLSSLIVSFLTPSHHFLWRVPLAPRCPPCSSSQLTLLPALCSVGVGQSAQGSGDSPELPEPKRRRDKDVSVGSDCGCWCAEPGVARDGAESALGYWDTCGRGVLLSGGDWEAFPWVPGVPYGRARQEMRGEGGLGARGALEGQAGPGPGQPAGAAVSLFVAGLLDEMAFKGPLQLYGCYDCGYLLRNRSAEEGAR